MYNYNITENCTNISVESIEIGYLSKSLCNTIFYAYNYKNWVGTSIFFFTNNFIELIIFVI